MTVTTTSRLEAYYRLHAAIYDATRWSFLFGRSSLIREIARLNPAPRRVLEVGCGTGKNLGLLARLLPGAELRGVDLSGEMLNRARQRLAPLGPRVRLLHQSYDSPLALPGGFDLVLFSYSLSMINPGWERAIAAAVDDLAPGGRIAVVDFESTPLGWFRRWMGVNHVRMDGHLPPALLENSRPLLHRSSRAYSGCWRYFHFIGQKEERVESGGGTRPQVADK